LVPERASTVGVEDGAPFLPRITVANQDTVCFAQRKLTNVAPRLMKGGQRK
jgi:hypothetical protein